MMHLELSASWFDSMGKSAQTLHGSIFTKQHFFTCIISSVNYRGGTVTAWKLREELETFIHQRRKEPNVKILRQHLNSSVGSENSGWTTTSACRVVRKWLQKRKVSVLLWPLKSPDLSPVEKMWTDIGWPTNLTQFYQFCQK